MTAPVVPTKVPEPTLTPVRNVIAEMRAALAGAREAGASDEQMDFLLRAWTREVQNVNEAEQLAAEPAATDAQRQLGGIAALIKDIPGMEAVAAGARGVVRGQPYREALSDIQGATAAAPALARIPNRIIGGGIAAASLPIKSPALAGATYGGLLGALQADPDAGLGERTFDAAVNAGVGAAAGKLSDMGSTYLRAKFAPRYDVAKDALRAEGQAAARPLYRQARAEGAANLTTPVTPELDDFLNEPDVQQIVAGLRTKRAFRDVAPNDPRFLDAIFKALSDTETGIRKGMQVLEPGKPNLLSASADDVAAAKGQFLNAVSDAPGAPMPTYRSAKDAAREGFRNVDALKRGYNLGRVETGQTMASGPVERWGTTAFDEAMAGATPEMREAATTGLLGAANRKMGQSSVLNYLNPTQRSPGREAIGRTGELLRHIEGTAAENAAEPLATGTLLDYLQRILSSSSSGSIPNREYRP